MAMHSHPRVDIDCQIDSMLSYSYGAVCVLFWDEYVYTYDTCEIATKACTPSELVDDGSTTCKLTDVGVLLVASCSYNHLVHGVDSSKSCQLGSSFEIGWKIRYSNMFLFYTCTYIRLCI